MRNLRDRDHALKVSLHEGSARRKSAGSAGFAAQGMITSIRLDNKKPRRINCSRKRTFASNR
jgi:hypothetical protein